MASRSPVFRVETYEITSSDFTGSVYRLHLRHELSTHYFAMVEWGVAASAVYNLSDMLVRVTADPYGTGDLNLADGNYLELTRATATNPCAMKVVVVECLRDEDGAGFRLLDVQATSLAASVGTGVQTTTDTCATAWPDATRVALFGGYRGGGMSGSASSAQLQTGGARIYPSSTATINIERYASASSNLAAATLVTYCVQWGAEWLVQRVNVTGTNTGATLASTGHYSTGALTYTITRAKSWVWMASYTDGNNPGASFLGQVATIGDGVTQNSTETTVAVGGMAGITQRSASVYVLTHQQLVAEYDFRATGSGSGASSVTVAAPQVAETYRTADGLLYVASTRGERLGLCMAGVTTTAAGDVSETQIHARPTSSTAVTATPADTSPSASWAGWIETVDFGAIDTPAGKLPVFRVTSYRVGSGQFTGTTYTLALLYTLADHYFVMIQGATASASTQDVDDVNARVTSDPAGTGDLEATGSNGLILTRAAAGADWVGTVTVVECLRSPDQQGFRLRSVVDVTMSGTSADRQITETTLSGVTYGDLDRVQVLVGYRGGGVTTDGSGSTSGHNAVGAVYGRPFGTAGVRLHRRSSATMQAMTACAYVIEWGSAWTLRRQSVEAVAGGADLDATGEFSAPSLLGGAVTAARAALFASAVADGANANQNYTGAVAALGDGVTVGTSPSTVAVGVWSNAASPYEALTEVLVHADLAVNQVHLASNTGTTGTLTVSAPLTSEHYGTYNSLAYTCGRRLPMAHTACSLAADSVASSVVQSRLTGPTTQTWLRDRNDSTSSVTGWFQAIDLGGIYADSEAIQVNADPDDLDVPVGYLILQDPHWEGSGNVVSATSEAGAVLGLVEAATSNRGGSYAYQEGEPTGTTELTLRTQGGAPGTAGGWLYRLATETTAASWKAMNALTILMRSKSITTSASLDAHGLVYSAAYDRVIDLWIDDASTVQVRYRAAGSPLATATSTTFNVQNADATGPNTGLDACELPDGTLLCCLQTSTSLARDMDLYASADGGTTWSSYLKGVQRRIPGSVGYSGDQGQHCIRSSADYVRIIYESTTAVSGNTTLYDWASADRGASWEAVGALTAYSYAGINAGHTGSTAWDVVGIGDVAGTFLWARANNVANCDTVQLYVAVGTEAFAAISSLTFAVTSYLTGAKVKAIWFTRVPDYVLLWVWVEGSDGSEVVLHRGAISDVTDPANWTTLGAVSGFEGVLRYGPHRPRSVWAGNQVVISAGLHDSTVSTGADAVVGGHWSFVVGGWDTKPLAPTLQDAGSEWYLGDALYARLISYQWSASTGSPVLTSPSSWTFVGAATTTWTSDKVNITTSSAVVTGYYNLSLTPVSNAECWGNSTGRGFTFRVRLKQNNQRSTSAEDCGIRIKAPITSGALTTGYDFTVRTNTTQIEVYDNISGGGTSLAVITTTDAASEFEIEVTIASTSVWVARRKVSDGVTGAWTESGPYTVTSGTITGQRLRVGILAAPGAGTSDIDVYEILVSNGSDLGQRADLTRPDDLMGAIMSLEPTLVTAGVSVGWGGGGSPDGDTFTAALAYQRGVVNLGLDSPSYYWESTALTEQDIVFQADADSGTGARWQVEAMLLVGTVDRTCTVEFSDTDTWTSPAESLELDATLWEDLTVIAVDGCAVQLEAATGEVFAPWRGELLGTYLRFTVAGTATGKTYAVRADQFSEDGWVAVADGVDLSSAGVTVGAKACLYADRMVLLAASRYRYRYFRLVFPDLSTVGSSLGTPTSTHRLGSLVPGHYLEFNRQNGPLKVDYTDTEEPMMTTARAKSGIEHRVNDGPSTRSVGMEVTCVDPEAPTGSRGEVGRMIRDLLRVAHDGYTRPVGLIMDSTWRARSHVVFGVLNRDGTALDQGVPYKGEEGSRRFFSVSSLKLRLDEEG